MNRLRRMANSDSNVGPKQPFEWRTINNVAPHLLSVSNRNPSPDCPFRSPRCLFVLRNGFCALLIERSSERLVFSLRLRLRRRIRPWTCPSLVRQWLKPLLGRSLYQTCSLVPFSYQSPAPVSDPYRRLSAKLPGSLRQLFRNAFVHNNRPSSRDLSLFTSSTYYSQLLFITIFDRPTFIFVIYESSEHLPVCSSFNHRASSASVTQRGNLDSHPLVRSKRP
ncbi:hypothetical protein BDZ85DRAFT_50798 [Elsinoe ampelina]|uniref:Uncharacterized protein n=1 Tax=Elsinoe ampelina TaxID=302913 RepID=A0A6A6GLQ5_9PEZI|nr:hypothetical protein BDZ85DRAFT_50798 [Elsinoe ampelina]